VDKDGDLENGVRVEMDVFDSVVIKGTTEEVASRKAESTLEERRKHHNFNHIGCRNVLSSGGAPLEHGVVGEKMIRNKFVNFGPTLNTQLEEVRM
jgi:hypothetical protein